MANVALKLEVELTSIDCGDCGGTYAINERYRKQCATYGRAWNCPYCRTGWGYAGAGELDRLKQQNAAAEAAKLRALAEANELRNQVAKMKRRAANGLCPCCKRTFVNLQRHMAAKHKDYAK